MKKNKDIIIKVAQSILDTFPEKKDWKDFIKYMNVFYNDKPHICFHPEGHLRGKVLKEFKKNKKK